MHDTLATAVTAAHRKCDEIVGDPLLDPVRSCSCQRVVTACVPAWPARCRCERRGRRDLA
jgi:hypothetical protein